MHKTTSGSGHTRPQQFENYFKTKAQAWLQTGRNPKVVKNDCRCSSRSAISFCWSGENLRTADSTLDSVVDSRPIMYWKRMFFRYSYSLASSREWLWWQTWNEENSLNWGCRAATTTATKAPPTLFDPCKLHCIYCCPRLDSIRLFFWRLHGQKNTVERPIQANWGWQQSVSNQWA